MIKKIENIYGDNVGYVGLVSFMGDQYTPAEDARMSTNKGRLGPEKDLALQLRLLKDAHTSPFEGVVIKMEVCAPLFVIRELDRHRTLGKLSEQDGIELVTPEEGMRKWFARNEMSGRYIQMPNDYYHPSVVRGQSKVNNQGGGKVQQPVDPVVAEAFVARGKELTRQARELYEESVAAGIEKGLARIYNTQNQYTKIRYTGSLKNFCDMLFLRKPNDVLWECRVAAEAIEQLLDSEFKDAMDQWRKNVYDTVKLDKEEVNYLRSMFDLIDCMTDSPDYKIAQSILAKLEAKRK